MPSSLRRLFGAAILAAYSAAQLADTRAADTHKEFSLSSSRKQELEDLMNTFEFSLRAEPCIEGIQLHHVIDRNKDGVIQAPDEIEAIYADRSLKYTLRVKKPIPAQGYLKFYVPQHPYWGTTIDVRVVEYSLRSQEREEWFLTNRVDLTTSNATNSFTGKAQFVIPLAIEEHKKARNITEKHDYHLTVMGRNGNMHSCIFTVDYTVPPAQTNAVQKINSAR